MITLKKNILNKVLASVLLAGLTLMAFGQKTTLPQKAISTLCADNTRINTQLLTQSKQFMQQNQGRLPRTCIAGGYIHTLPQAVQQEVRLARQVHYQLTKHPQPNDKIWLQLQKLYASKEKKQPRPTPAQFLPILQTWVQAHNNRRPRLNIYENSRHLTVAEMRQKDKEEGTALYEEHHLAQLLSSFMHEGVDDKNIREALATIEKLPTITHWQSTKDSQFYDGFGNALPTQYQLLDQLQTWSSAHGNTKPRTLFYKNGKRIRVEELKQFPALYEEYQLGYRFQLVLRKKGQPIDLKQAFNAFNDLPLYNPKLIR